jgi:hypothetical protein
VDSSVGERKNILGVELRSGSGLVVQLRGVLAMSDERAVNEVSGVGVVVTAGVDVVGPLLA